MNTVGRGASEGRTDEKKRSKCPECKNEIRDRGLIEELPLGSRRKFNKTIRKTIGLEITQ